MSKQPKSTTMQKVTADLKEYVQAVFDGTGYGMIDPNMGRVMPDLGGFAVYLDEKYNGVKPEDTTLPKDWRLK
jgi:hypothetical protein